MSARRLADCPPRRLVRYQEAMHDRYSERDLILAARIRERCRIDKLPDPPMEPAFRPSVTSGAGRGRHKRVGGRPRSVTPAQEAEFWRLRGQGLSLPVIADELGIKLGCARTIWEGGRNAD